MMDIMKSGMYYIKKNISIIVIIIIIRNKINNNVPH